MTRQRSTPKKICKRVVAIASPIQPRLATLKREARSRKSTLRNARYNSAAETSTFSVEIIIRRIEKLVGLRRLTAAARRAARNCPPWYGFVTVLAIGGTGLLRPPRGDG